MTAISEEIVNAGHGPLSPIYFAVHSTANPGATARNHRDLWSRDYPYAVHLVSDWTEAIHCVPYDALCWQVGNGNATCEGLEICEATNLDDFNRGIDIAASVAAQRLNAHGWDVSRMHPHQWFSQTYGGSDHTDPYPYFSRYGYTWEAFTSLVQDKMQGEDMPSAQEIANAVWNFDQNGTLMRDRIQGADQAANTAAQVLTGDEFKWLGSRVYRTMLAIKRMCGIPDQAIDIPDQVNIQLTEQQLDAIADRIAAKLK